MKSPAADKPQNMRRVLLCVMLGFMLVFTNGCVSLTRDPGENDTDPARQEVATTTESAVVAPADMGWWQVGFHRAIESNEEPYWHLDALIAYEVIKPVLDQQQFDLWRFHRRAVSDASGHKFSFIFYSTRSTAEQVYQQVKGHPLVNALQNAEVVERLSFIDINGEARTNIEDTSDKSWSLELQKAWPAFIMGVSQTWLNLIDEYAGQTEAIDNEDITSRLERFEQINNRINSVWEMEGGHAFLHHLNALFGYQELYIIERRRTRF
jgi:hypothetical protein